MPIISRVGRRSTKLRLFIGFMYTVLILGAITMVYPLLLMVSNSVKSESDYVWVTPFPRYLVNDDVLWMKYVETKYSLVRDAEKAMFRSFGSWRRLDPPEIDDHQSRRAERFSSFREQVEWPLEWYGLGFLGHGEAAGHARNGRAFGRAIDRRFDGDIAAFSDAVGIPYKAWWHVDPPNQGLDARRFTFPQTPDYRVLDDLKREAPPADRMVVNLDGVFAFGYLRRNWSTIEAYNEAHGTAHESYGEVLLPAVPPADGPAREDWDQFVRFELNLAFIRLDPALAPAWRAYLDERYAGDIGTLNGDWLTTYGAFTDVPLPQGIAGTARAHRDYGEFVKDAERCPLDAMSVYGPRQGFERFLAEQDGASLDSIEPEALPIEAVDYLDFQDQTGALRWEFIKRNYAVVIDYILVHGNGVRNTVIYCALMIFAALLINPLAAYALSRYKPPSTYKILLFCMCTMAFPPEVTMIPAFLLLRSFPAVGLGVAVAAALGAAWLLGRVAPRMPDALRGIGAGVAGLAIGFYLLPRVFGEHATHVSLLNTFWALILPAAANGFSIFLLKGFFDSLPRELYEAAEIDGGGEWTKFWTITMSLSKPILAVLALQAFTAAYSEFMMALVIIPDESMWTLMVWLYQLHTQVPPYVVNASLVVAAIPTFLIFLFCQNIIMRGIIVPVEK